MEYQFDYSKIVGFNTILYGESGTGKSTIILDILYSIKDLIPTCVVISPTEDQNRTYSGVIPDFLIDSSDLSQEKLKAKLCAVVKRQQTISKVYKQANDKVVLEELYNIVIDSGLSAKNTQSLIKKINIIKEQIHILMTQLQKAEIDALDSIQDKLKAKIKSYEDQINKNIKAIIDNNKQHLIDKNLVSKQQEQIIDNLHLNPNILVILDDCGSIFDNSLQKDPSLKNIFFAGRHYFITLMIAVQSDKTVSLDLRSQAFYSIFCSSRVIEQFSKSNSGLDVKTGRFYAEKLKVGFQDNDRLVFSRKENKCQIFRAQKRGNFRFGSSIIWDYCDFMGTQRQGNI